MKIIYPVSNTVKVGDLDLYTLFIYGGVLHCKLKNSANPSWNVCTVINLENRRTLEIVANEEVVLVDSITVHY